ncbi:hypothetical protein HGB25_01750 [Candidatus Saccharibacteria bacterium]|nr:hypothetical protein [Candidatus Saccharibacteria bacterium]
MLILGSRLIGTPIMSLQTGAQLASIKAPVIDTSNLKIVGYEVEGPLLDIRPALLRIDDVRELSNVGMIIDSSDEFVGVDDVIDMGKMYKLNFKLIGLQVISESKQKLGRVSDYSLDTSSFVIQQLNVRHGIIKSFTDTELLIHRSQIVEINDSAIVVRSTAQNIKPVASPASNSAYLNPFRSSVPSSENRK